MRHKFDDIKTKSSTFFTRNITYIYYKYIKYKYINSLKKSTKGKGFSDHRLPHRKLRCWIKRLQEFDLKRLNKQFANVE